MIKRSRRRFLKIAVAVTAGVSAIGIVTARLNYDTLRRRYYRLSIDIPPGSLSNETLRVLMAMTDALIGESVERSHYEEFWSWRAANIPGHRGLYERVATMLNRLGEAAAQRPFAQLNLETRRGIIDELLQWQGHKLRKLWVGVVDSDRLYFNRFLVQPVLELYARTDAWIHLGYKAWRGQPRGLDRYRVAPR